MHNKGLDTAQAAISELSVAELQGGGTGATQQTLSFECIRGVQGAGSRT